MNESWEILGTSRGKSASWGKSGGAECGQDLERQQEQLVESVSPYFFSSSTRPTARSQHRIKSEHFHGVDDGWWNEWSQLIQEAMLGEESRTGKVEVRIWMRLMTLAFCHQGKRRSSGNELSDESTWFQHGLFSDSWHTAGYLPGGSLCLSLVFDLLFLVPHILFFLDEFSCCGGAHPA